jgi:hypothetical protein
MSFLGKLTKAGLNPWGSPVAASLAGTSGQILVIMRDRNKDISMATGTDVPSNATSGYAKGCLYIDRDVVTGSTGLYENIGTNTSCNFNAIGAITAGEVTLVQGSVLIGNAGGVATALDGKGDAKVLVGNGTTMTSVALSQDLTITNAGVVSIAKINNLATAAEVNAVCDGNTATADEIVRACDLTGRVVTIVETGAITTALHSDRVCMLGEVGGNALVTLTLPEATGSGAKFKFIVSVVNTSSYVIVVADTTNANFIGNVINQDADLVGTIAAIMYPAPVNADTITLDGAGTGGQLGDFIELVDVAADVWAVNGIVSCPTGSNTATPFSAAV